MSIDINKVLEINMHFPADKPIRVATYFRVGRQSTELLSKIELQNKYYQKIVEEQSNWIYTGMYADEGVKNRAQFNTMIWEAKAGKIDLIVTKSFSHLSRNVMDCITVAHDLLKLKKPVGIYFENEALCTLCSQADMLLCFLSIMAIVESENKSKHIGCVFPRNPTFNKK